MGNTQGGLCENWQDKTQWPCRDGVGAMSLLMLSLISHSFSTSGEGAGNSLLWHCSDGTCVGGKDLPRMPIPEFQETLF